MNRIRSLFFVIGLIFFTLGMTAAGLIKIFDNQLTIGIICIVLTVMIIAICSFHLISGKKES
ncbi:MAG: hypothetical protein VR68_10185 [Peptococcaceae bacterium BRH_c4a]|nr:MAG: hypothetical protein VR68_10185 [Peptococcaceae bacterium BRH_c4a]